VGQPLHLPFAIGHERLFENRIDRGLGDIAGHARERLVEIGAVLIELPHRAIRIPQW
jgi:hypothetical protein